MVNPIAAGLDGATRVNVPHWMDVKIVDNPQLVLSQLQL